MSTSFGWLMANAMSPGLYSTSPYIALLDRILARKLKFVQPQPRIAAAAAQGVVGELSGENADRN